MVSLKPKSFTPSTISIRPSDAVYDKPDSDSPLTEDEWQRMIEWLDRYYIRATEVITT